MHESPAIQTTFGYLTAVESPDHGYFGGYLIVSTLGRPLEFHCTAPVRPSRAQRILYGPTLGSYLLAEQIGGALLAAAKLCPALILTDHADFNMVQGPTRIPIALAQLAHTATNDSPGSAISQQFDTSASTSSAVVERGGFHGWNPPLRLGDYLLQLPYGCESDQSQVESLIERLLLRVDLLEPFGRIHEAIGEAQRIGTRSQDAHGQAA